MKQSFTPNLCKLNITKITLAENKIYLSSIRLSLLITLHPQFLSQLVVYSLIKNNTANPSLLTELIIFRTLFNKGSRVPIRGKVNEALTTGLRIVDTILPIGRGQRQLIIGDRFTGKTTVQVNTMINQNKNNYLKSVEGFGSKRLFGVYLGINNNLSRIYNLTVIFYKFNVN